MSQAAQPASAGGKAKRPCPVLGSTISPADCGTRRGTQLPCPADCPFFPFGTVAPELWERLSGRWFEKAAAHVVAKVGRPRLEQVMVQVTPSRANRSAATSAAFETALYTLLFLPGPGGAASLADRWEADRWAGLNNDEQLMMRCRRESRVTTLEFHRPAPEPGFLECIDLLNPESPPVRLWLPALASPLIRFTRLYGWITPYPHFSRPGLNLRPVPRELWPAWRDEIARRHQAAAAARPGLSLAHFLRETVAESDRLFAQLLDDHHRQLRAGLDLFRCTARFTLALPAAEIAALFRAHPEFVSTPLESVEPAPLECYAWKPPALAAPGPNPDRPEAGTGQEPAAPATLGFVRLFTDSLLLEIYGRSRYGTARTRLESLFGGQLRFEDEVVEDLQERIQATLERQRVVRGAEAAVFGEPAADDARSPDASEAVPAGPAETEAHERDHRAMLDSPRPELGGRTPRAASADPALRPALIELVKDRLYATEAHNRRTGSRLSLDRLLDELGLTELK